MQQLRKRGAPRGQPQLARTRPFAAREARADSFCAAGLEFARIKEAQSPAGGMSASVLREIVC